MPTTRTASSDSTLTLLAAIEQSPVGVMLLDAEGTVVFENARVRDTAGGEGWSGCDATRLPGVSALLRTRIRALVAHGRTFQDVESVVDQAEGERRHIVASGAPVKGIEGRSTLVVTVLDVTDYRAGEAARALQLRVEAAEAALRHTALTRPDTLALLEAAVARVAETFEATAGVALVGPGETLIRCAGWPPGAPPDVPYLDLDAWPLVLTGGPVVVLPGTPQSDRLLDGLSSQTALLLPITGAVPGVLAVGRDAEWSVAEVTAGQRLAALFSTLWGWIEAEARFQRTVADLDDALFTFGYLPDGRRAYAFVTPQIEALTGLDPDGILAGDTDWTALVHADDREAFAAHDARLQNGEASRIDVRLVLARGETVWISERATPSMDAAGRPVAGGLVSDITVRKEAEANLDRARRVAERSAQARMAFLRLMSHELRTPLGAIRGFSDLLIEEVQALPDASPEITEFAGTIRDAATRALRLVADLLDLSRLETGTLDLACMPVDVAPLVRGVAGRIAVQMDAANDGRTGPVELRIDTPASAVACADAVRLEQVVHQLLDNAVAFTDAGSVSVTVETTPAAVLVTVADTGVGMEDAFLETVFEPFAQEDVRVNRDRNGTGLGLAIARRLVEGMDGQLRVRSAKGEGSTFTVALPLPEAPES